MTRSWLVYTVALVAAGCWSGRHVSDGEEIGDPSPIETDGGLANPPPPKGPQPAFGPTVSRETAPPPLSGGTLLVTRDGNVVASDPDRDRVYVVTLADGNVTSIALTPGDEPGRLAEDDDGHVHVALRRAGAVATLDPLRGTVLARRQACPAPRGVAFDAERKRLLVACEGGELVAVPPSPDGTPSLVARLERDLRDIVVSATGIWVSHFRTANIERVSSEGTNLATTRPRWEAITASVEATLAWRMIPALAGDPVQDPIVVHQMASTRDVAPRPGGYGPPPESTDDCSPDGIVIAAITHVRGRTMNLPKQVVLPLDIATNGSRFAVVAAGNAHTPLLPQVFMVSADPDAPCASSATYDPSGEVIALAFVPGGELVVQSREPAQLELLPSRRVIPLAPSSVSDTGHAIFHANSGSGLACASCHGEGGDDGHVWSFDGLGARRTPTLRGTLEGTAPYHWNGEMKDIAELARNVMTGRMNGPDLDGAQMAALQRWLFALPPPARSLRDAAAAERGRALFTRADVGCTECHAGPKLTTSATVDVGTGGEFQVPSLVGMATHAPFQHDGCAKTLKDRFTSCQGASHGDVSKLSSSDLDDLVAYLESL